MSFWDINEEVSDKFEISGGDGFSVIPANTQCLAVIDECKWDQDREGNRYISLRWSVLAPAEYKNRKLFQKLWVKDDNPSAKDPAKKREQAKRMLMAIDAFAGGKLRASGQEPTDDLMQTSIEGRPMLIKVMVWKMTDKMTNEVKEGNWIAGVERKNGAAPVQKKIDDDIPF